MENQDYLKKQIDQIGKILAKIFSDLLRLKNNEEINIRIEVASQELKDELNLDIQDLIDIPNDNFITILTKQKNLTNDNLNKLAEVLLIIADNSQVKNKKLYEKCLIIYEYLEKTENIYSLDRQWKTERIKNNL